MTANINAPAAWIAIVAGGIVLLLLAGLHVLSPEFDPSWRVVSEYANGRYGWVLSLMFACWAVSTWALAVALWSELHGLGGKIALAILIAAGIGEAMAAGFDINHPLHNLAGMIGVPSLPIAAMWISPRLSRRQAWAPPAKYLLLGTANLTWMSLVLMIAAFILMTSGRARPADQATPNMIVFVGWANRLLVVAYCLWVVTVAGQALRLGRQARQMVEQRLAAQ